MSAAKPVYTGSCFCKTVGFESRGELGSMSNCHCTDCRTSHAAAFATYIDAPRDGFRFTRGESNLTTYQAPSGTKRSFCKTCGTILTCHGEGFFELSAAAIDTPFDRKPEYHGYVRSKAAWYEILDGRPQYSRNKGDA